MNKIPQLKDVKNVIFTNFTRGYARVSIDNEVKQIRFTTEKDDYGRITFEVTRGLEYCIF